MGCGYKPADRYHREILGDNIDLAYKVSAENPEEGIFIKDGFIENIYTTLHDKLGEGGSKVKITSSKGSLSPLDYDTKGYPIVYRSSVTIKVKITSPNGKTRTYSATGDYDFAVTAKGVVNHQLKLSAFKKATTSAINKLLAKIALDQLKEEEKKKEEKENNTSNS